MLHRDGIPTTAALLATLFCCSFETRSDEFACTEPADCDDGRTCVQGWCVFPSPFDGAVDAPTADAGPVADAGVGYALEFDGVNDFVRVAREVAGDFTLEAWIRTTTSLDGGDFWDGRGLVYADVAGNDDDFGVAILNGHLAFGTGNPNTTIESTTTVTTGEWIHIAAVREQSSGTITVFVGGVEETRATTGNSGLLDGPVAIDIGGNTIDGHYFDGTIDEVRVWAAARNESEIQATMAAPLTGTEAGLVGYWRFDDGSGAVAEDSTSSNNDGSFGDGSPAGRPDWVTPGAPGF